VKLDPRSIPYRAIQGGVQLGGLLLFAFVFTANDPALGLPAVVFLLGIGILATVTWGYLYYQRFEYDLTDDTFDIDSGVLSRREREIPYGRIHNVDVAQNTIQRFIGIAEVRLETAGGGETEATLQYVSRAEADRLQEEISRRKRGAEPRAETEADAGEELFRMGPRELGILGLVSADLRVLGLVSILASGFGPTVAEAMPTTIGFLLTLGPAVAVVALLGYWLLSAVRAVLRYDDFRLVDHGEELRYERGLLQRYNGTIPLEKVQTVAIRENPLARRLGYATLVIETAGYTAGGEATVESAVPIGRRERVVELATDVEPVASLEVDRPPKRARTRYAVRYALAVLAVGAVAWGLTATLAGLEGGYLVFALLPLTPIAAHFTWIHRGYREDEDHVVTRAGFWRRETTIVPYDRVQTVLSSQTVFQRRRRLASVVVDTAGSGGFVGGDAVAIDIDADVAERLRESVADRLQRALV